MPIVKLPTIDEFSFLFWPSRVWIFLVLWSWIWILGLPNLHVTKSMATSNSMLNFELYHHHHHHHPHPHPHPHHHHHHPRHVWHHACKRHILASYFVAHLSTRGAQSLVSHIQPSNPSKRWRSLRISKTRKLGLSGRAAFRNSKGSVLSESNEVDELEIYSYRVLNHVEPRFWG